MIKINKAELLFPILIFLAIFICWEIASRMSFEMLFILPPPSRILSQMWQKDDRLIYHTGVTFKTMAGGITLALIVAFPLAWIMVLWKTARLVFQPVFVIAQCVPMFALAPMMVLWFGWGYTAIVVPTALMIFLPLTMNVYQGIQSTPHHFLDYFRIHQATPWQMLYKLQLPWAAPHIFAGLRVAAAIAGIGAIAGEWAGAQEGLGLLMLESRRGMDLEMMFGALFCLMLLSLGFYGIIALIERQVFRYKFVHLMHRAVVASCFLLTLFGFSSCQTEQSELKLSEQHEQNLQETRLVLDWLPNPNHVPLYVGIEKGYFSQHGIKLKLHKIQNAADPIPYLQAGQTELAISYMPTMIKAIAHGANVTPIGVLIPQPLNALIYRIDSSIKTAADLNGKVFGYCVDGSGTKILDDILEQNGIVPSEKRNVSFDLVGTLGTKQVDVIYGAFWNIECEQLHILGIDTNFIELTDLGYPTYYELIVLAKKDSVQAGQEFFVGFQAALQQSIDFCQNYPEESFEIYLAANLDKGEKAREWERASWHRTYPLLAKTQKIDQNVWKVHAEWLNSQ